MSFNFEFVAEREDAVQILSEENAPVEVKNFISVGLRAFKPGSLVHVKAVGHLYNNDYQISTGALVVEQVYLRKPKAPL